MLSAKISAARALFKNKDVGASGNFGNTFFVGAWLAGVSLQPAIVVKAAPAVMPAKAVLREIVTVSYTHLTLPTIYSV